ncbi:PqqD family protein [Micromonospora sp. NBRC 101691]|uniref:PqqD family protein n=1 Tax=Micromonospora TaxID=1873 RepID=UPI00249FDC47|nr:PqqD family protein [Micromonospora sp. NBRC 101691]GLY26196.1 hypothetical protein Misp04_59270 [Micromonospora sp. NBRC 101691]
MSESPTASLESVPRLILGIRIRNFRGTIMVSSGAESFELTDVAAFIFRQIDGRSTVGAIAVDLAAEFEVDKATAQVDTAEFVGWLRAQGVVEFRQQAGPGHQSLK